MILRMQDFDFAQTYSNLPKFYLGFDQICPNFASILHKSNQFPNKIFVRGCS